MEGFLRFEPRVVMSEFRLAAKVRHLSESAYRSAGRAQPLRVIPWHSPYNMRKKITGKPSVRVAEKFQLYRIYYINMATFYR